MSCRVVFMGSPLFATPTLKALKNKFEVVHVFSQPDKPIGRGQLLTPTPVKITARELGISCSEPDKLEEPRLLDLFENLNPDAIVVVAYGKLLPKKILELPPLGCLNLHASLLPRHRGPSPISNCILSGDEETGNTVMLMDEGIDTGAIVAQRRIDIGAHDTAEDLHNKLMELGPPLMVETIINLMNKMITPVSQDGTKATYSRLVKKTDGLLDWNLDNVRLERIVRAMNPWPVAFFVMGKDNVKVWRAESFPGTAEPGMIKDITSEGLLVGTGKGLLMLNEVQAPSKKRISGSEFARGRRLHPGFRII
ncbi:MAG: methionyl-tRNA formyltransferase [Pseudomonadota bacterium]